MATLFYRMPIYWRLAGQLSPSWKSRGLLRRETLLTGARPNLFALALNKLRLSPRAPVWRVLCYEFFVVARRRPANWGHPLNVATTYFCTDVERRTDELDPSLEIWSPVSDETASSQESWPVPATRCRSKLRSEIDSSRVTSFCVSNCTVPLFLWHRSIRTRRKTPDFVDFCHCVFAKVAAAKLSAHQFPSLLRTIFFGKFARFAKSSPVRITQSTAGFAFTPTFAGPQPFAGSIFFLPAILL